mmetsp:Transcript_30053/g.96564  ORF Transcript_30053/g.96564 Transcript_30053/m.96564 type:complete len:207 (+) Transcript_30053:1278-1898(+)
MARENLEASMPDLLLCWTQDASVSIIVGSSASREAPVLLACGASLSSSCWSERRELKSLQLEDATSLLRGLALVPPTPSRSDDMLVLHARRTKSSAFFSSDSRFSVFLHRAALREPPALPGVGEEADAMTVMASPFFSSHLLAGASEAPGRAARPHRLPPPATGGAASEAGGGCWGSKINFQLERTSTSSSSSTQLVCSFLTFSSS